MRYRVLGPMTVVDGDRHVRIGGPRQQTVLAVLLCHANHTVAQDALIDAVWAGDPPDAARATLQSYVYGLRQELGSDQIVRHGDGYRIELDAEGLDALHFEGLVALGRDRLSSDPAAARMALVDALGLWYGVAYGGLEDNPVVMSEASRLGELRVIAVEARVEADLTLGNHDGVVSELNSLVREFPLRERFRAQQMLALYRSGRQAEALEAFQQARTLLAEELGLDPSSELRDLEQRILDQDPSLLLDNVLVSRNDQVGPASDVGTRTATPGRSLRGFELREELGQGDFGTVFRAFQPAVGREVAIKVIRSEYANRPAFVQRFEREAQIVAQLEHPHIVPLFDYWRDPVGAYIVMPLLRGGSLLAALRRGGWNLAPSLQVLEQIGGALAHAHRRGVVHRDVKPGNVLLDEDGNAYLSDFGIAVRLSDDADVPQTTSLAYVPPEEFRGEPQTARSDVYALGVLTYQLVTGVTPQAGGPRPLLTGLRPELPATLDDVLARATDDNPARRHDKVEDFLRDLRRSVGVDVVDVTVRPPIPADEPVRNPYKGLRAFRETDAADFFGRDAVVDSLLEAVAGHNLVTIVGPSGSGKSSAVRAGLVPRLRAGGLPGSRHWLVTDMFPGSYPFEELEAALRRVAVDLRDGFVEELRDPRGLLRVTKQILPDEESSVVLVIDQFEELFSAVGSEATRRLFLENLTAVALDDRTRVRVVLTLRADFFDRPLEYAEFSKAMAPGLVSLGPPSRDGLAQAISAPARGVGVDLEPGLVGRIITDVEDQPGGLPLLQYTLTELFAQRSGDVLTVRDYERTGGVASALGRRAEELYIGLAPRAREAARQLFLRLVAVDESSADTRRRARLSELRALAADQDAIDQVLREFGSFRLLSFDRDPTSRGPTVEVAHEALLREWERLRGWIDERREGLALARRIAMATQDWSDSRRDPSFLMRGARLEQAERWRSETDIALTGDEADYLDTSLLVRQSEVAAARRRRRRLIVVLGAMLVVVSALAIAALMQRSLAQAEARDAEIRELAGESALALEEDPERAILLALEAVEMSRSAGVDPLAEAVGALQQAVQSSRLTGRFELGGPLHVLPGEPPLVVHGGAESSTEVTVATLGGEVVRSLPVDSAVVAVASHARTGRIAIAHQPGPRSGVIVYGAEGDVVQRLDTDGLAAVSMGFDAPGNQLVALLCDIDPQGRCGGISRTVVYDLGAGGSRQLLQLEGRAAAVAFVDDGIAVATNDPAGVALVGSDDRRLGFVPVASGPASFMAVTADGLRLAVSSIDASDVTVIDVAEQAVTARIPASREQAVAWSPDGRRLAVVGNTGVVRVVDVEMAETVHELRGAHDNLFFVAFTPDGDQVLASTFDLTLMWDVTDAGPDVLGAIPAALGPVYTFQASADGRMLLYSSAQASSMGVVDAATGKPMATRIDDLVGIDYGLRFANLDFTVVGALAADGTSSIRRLPDLSLVRTLEDCTSPLAFTTDGKLAFVTGRVCQVDPPEPPTSTRVMRVEDGRSVLELPIGWVFSAAFNPEGEFEGGRYLALTDQQVVEVHDLVAKSLVATISLEDVGSAAAGHLSVVFDRSGRYLAGGTSDGRVWVIDMVRIAEGAPVADALIFSQVVHTGPAPRPAVTSDGVVATIGFDSLVRLWDLSTGQLLTEFRTDMSEGAPMVQWTADETELLYPDGGSLIRRHPRDIDVLVDTARSMLTRELSDDECVRHLGAGRCSN